MQPLVNNECFNTVNISSVNESGLPIGLRSPGNKALFLHLWRAEIAFWKNAKAYIRDSTNTAWRWLSLLLCTDNPVFVLNLRHLGA